MGVLCYAKSPVVPFRRAAPRDNAGRAGLAGAGVRFGTGGGTGGGSAWRCPSRGARAVVPVAAYVTSRYICAVLILITKLFCSYSYEMVT
jgi:hypothetical protein